MGENVRILRTPILRKAYYAWQNMRQRCLNPKNPKYKDYGGRGIKVAAAWDSFQQFLDDVGLPPSTSNYWSLERDRVNGHYEPGNVRWADCYTQAKNKRINAVSQEVES